jgi:hypothetical protein
MKHPVEKFFIGVLLVALAVCCFPVLVAVLLIAGLLAGLKSS